MVRVRHYGITKTRDEKVIGVIEHCSSTGWYLLVFPTKTSMIQIPFLVVISNYIIKKKGNSCLIVSCRPCNAVSRNALEAVQ